MGLVVRTLVVITASTPSILANSWGVRLRSWSVGMPLSRRRASVWRTSWKLTV
ncbi:hypothetical protein [Hymenobacter lapidarius]|uniref:hypothetical protein n=1 Tax=Hymenobacter lapidarius TaxID=1908237 RepID=UPI001300DEF7|nr:hypothetical protein [Hymenobacter lapidarius]